MGEWYSISCMSLRRGYHRNITAGTLVLLVWLRKGLSGGTSAERDCREEHFSGVVPRGHFLGNWSWFSPLRMAPVTKWHCSVINSCQCCKLPLFPVVKWPRGTETILVPACGSRNLILWCVCDLCLSDPTTGHRLRYHTLWMSEFADGTGSRWLHGGWLFGQSVLGFILLQSRPSLSKLQISGGFLAVAQFKDKSWWHPFLTPWLPQRKIVQGKIVFWSCPVAVEKTEWN